MKKMKEITAKANKVLQNADSSIYTGKRIDIVKLAKTFGFEVGISKKLPIREDGFIFVAPDGTKKIVVNNFRSIEDKRFTVAHELGHYFLHKNRLDNLVLLREHKKDIESAEKDFEDAYKKLLEIEERNGFDDECFKEINEHFKKLNGGDVSELEKWKAEK